MILIFLICGILICLLPAYYGQQMGLIGDAIQAFGPCSNRILTMQKIIGGPPSKENYWDGTFNVDKLYPNLTEARFTLKLNAPANVSVDPEEGRIIFSNSGFHISYFRQNGFTNLKFRVEGEPFGKFPNPEYLSLNELDVCPNPKQWSPSIIGATNFAQDKTSFSSDSEQSKEDSSLTCGKRKVMHQGLITNGYPSDEGDWPWHAAIFHLDKNSFRYRCGGTILTTNTILTAAHCVLDVGKIIIAERVLVKLGLHHRLVSGKNTQEFLVFKVIAHEKFNSGNLENDIALLKLSTEATFTNYVQPICLWPSDEINIDNVLNRNGYVVGWGINANEKLSDILNQAQMPIVTQLECLASNRDFFGIFLSDKNFCGGFRNGTSVCNGDSGGGMFFRRGKTYLIRGIVSLSVAEETKDICDPKQFVIFTDIAKYLDWINEKL